MDYLVLNGNACYINFILLLLLFWLREHLRFLLTVSKISGRMETQ